MHFWQWILFPLFYLLCVLFCSVVFVPSVRLFFHSRSFSISCRSLFRCLFEKVNLFFSLPVSNDVTRNKYLILCCKSRKYIPLSLITRARPQSLNTRHFFARSRKKMIIFFSPSKCIFISVTILKWWEKRKQQKRIKFAFATTTAKQRGKKIKWKRE